MNKHLEKTNGISKLVQVVDLWKQEIDQEKAKMVQKMKIENSDQQVNNFQELENAMQKERRKAHLDHVNDMIYGGDLNNKHTFSYIKQKYDQIVIPSQN